MTNKRGGARPGAGRPRKSGDFAYPEFNNAQIKEFLDSHFVLDVSKRTISFTKEFKELFWQRYSDGVDPSEIFNQAGLSSKVLSRDRIYSFAKALKAQVANDQPFSNSNILQAQTERPFKPMKIPRRSNASRLLNLSEEDIAKLLN